jgi:hypothetical protein
MCDYVTKAGSARWKYCIISTPALILARCVEIGNRQFGGAREIWFVCSFCFFLRTWNFYEFFWLCGGKFSSAAPIKRPLTPSTARDMANRVVERQKNWVPCFCAPEKAKKKNFGGRSHQRERDNTISWVCVKTCCSHTSCVKTHTSVLKLTHLC